MAENYSVQTDSGSTGAVPPENQQPATNQDSEGNQRPEWLPEKFQSADELAKAYAELEAKLGQGGSGTEEQPAETGDGQETAENQTDNEGDDQKDGPYYSEAVDSALNNAGVDPAEVQREFTENQQLGEETYSKLEEAGYPREMVDAYIDGIKARTQGAANEQAEAIMKEAGGQEGYAKVTEWAASNLTEQEISEFNRAVEGGAEAAKWAVRGLYAQYRQSEGQEPSRSLSGRTSQGPTDTFTSTQQVVEAMKDSRYQNDPAFRKQVQEKLKRSNVF